MSDYVCEELIVEIFTRLPPKTLIRFRSVSKSFCSCISSPSFIRLHTIRSPQKVLLKHTTMFLEDFHTLHSTDRLPSCPKHGYDGITPFEFPLKCFYIVVGSCNGILCILYQECSFMLWNPSVRRMLSLPDHPSWRYRVSGNYVAAMGFGFDPITNDYKIVTISYKFRDEGVQNAFLYTMKTRTWCEISFPITSYYYVDPRGYLVNGVLHWLTTHFVKETWKIGHKDILTFDLSTHVFDTIELPRPINEGMPFTNINETLGLISSNGKNTRIWVRSIEYYDTSSWVVYFQGEVDTRRLGISIQLSVNGDLLFVSFPGGFQVNNSETSIQSRLVAYSIFSADMKMERYVESLELLEIGTTYAKDQLSFLGGKKRWKTTLRLIWHFCECCASELGDMCFYLLRRLHIV